MNDKADDGKTEVTDPPEDTNKDTESSNPDLIADDPHIDETAEEISAATKDVITNSGPAEGTDPLSNDDPSIQQHNMLRFTESIGALIKGDWSIGVSINLLGHNCLAVIATPRPDTPAFTKLHGRPIVVKSSIRDCKNDNDILAVMGAASEELCQRVVAQTQTPAEEEKQIEIEG